MCQYLSLRGEYFAGGGQGPKRSVLRYLLCPELLSQTPERTYFCPFALRRPGRRRRPESAHCARLPQSFCAMCAFCTNFCPSKPGAGSGKNLQRKQVNQTIILMCQTKKKKVAGFDKMAHFLLAYIQANGFPAGGGPAPDGKGFSGVKEVYIMGGPNRHRKIWRVAEKRTGS